MKGKLAVLLDKSGNDDKLIEALRAELVSLRTGNQIKAADVVSKEELFKQIGALQQVRLLLAECATCGLCFINPYPRLPPSTPTCPRTGPEHMIWPECHAQCWQYCISH